jgi:hypothetical protein
MAPRFTNNYSHDASVNGCIVLSGCDGAVVANNIIVPHANGYGVRTGYTV